MRAVLVGLATLGGLLIGLIALSLLDGLPTPARSPRIAIWRLLTRFTGTEERPTSSKCIDSKTEGKRRAEKFIQVTGTENTSQHAVTIPQ